MTNNLKLCWAGRLTLVCLWASSNGWAASPVVITPEMDFSSPRPDLSPAPAPVVLVAPPAKKKKKGLPIKYRVKNQTLLDRCNAGVASECRRLSERYVLEEDFENGSLFLQKACLENDAISCDRYGDQNSGVEAALAFKKACDRGLERACKKLLPLAELLPPGQRPGTARSSPVPEAYRGSQLTYELLCDRTVDECSAQGAALLEGADRERGLVLLKGACERKFAPACLKMAVDYEKAGDVPRALREYLSACDHGRADACEKSRQLKKQGFVAAPN